jgi:hypothetical protein
MATSPYNILSKCGKVYIGQTGSMIGTGVKERDQHIHLYHPEKSVVAKHSINIGHWVWLQNTTFLAKTMKTYGPDLKGSDRDSAAS